MTLKTQKFVFHKLFVISGSLLGSDLMVFFDSTNLKFGTFLYTFVDLFLIFEYILGKINLFCELFSKKMGFLIILYKFVKGRSQSMHSYDSCDQVIYMYYTFL